MECVNAATDEAQARKKTERNNMVMNGVIEFNY
jgi:hypothetical protein